MGERLGVWAVAGAAVAKWWQFGRKQVVLSLLHSTIHVFEAPQPISKDFGTFMLHLPLILRVKLRHGKMFMEYVHVVIFFLSLGVCNDRSHFSNCSSVFMKATADLSNQPYPTPSPNCSFLSPKLRRIT
jgi:hypothetical protein